MARKKCYTAWWRWEFAGEREIVKILKRHSCHRIPRHFGDHECPCGATKTKRVKSLIKEKNNGEGSSN